MSVVRSRIDGRLRAVLTSVRPLEDPRTGERIGAASAVLAQNGRLFCVQDDALSAAWIDPVTLSIEKVVLLGRGERLPKHRKADFEAAFQTEDGAIYVLGSGGTALRRSIARFAPSSQEVEVIDARALYDAIGARLTVAPNIEGAVLLGDTVRLFHRANGRNSGLNASFDIALGALHAGTGAIENEVFYDLGAVEQEAAGSGRQSPYRRGEQASESGAALTFTDATRFADGRVLYLAAAEDTEDAIADGPVLGAALGVLEADGGRYALITEADGTPSQRKAEGVALLRGEREAWLVTDPDDEAKTAELCCVTLEGPW
jgi:hypothetical protein